MSYTRALCLSTCLLLPATGFTYDLNSGDQNYGRIDALLKGQAVLHGEDNGYDPNTGAAYMLKLKYITPSIHGFTAAAGAYVNGDLFGLTDWDEKVARGIFVHDEGDATAQLGEIYVQYRGERLHAFGGRGLLDSPLTKTPYSTVPTFYTSFSVGGKPTKTLDLGLTQITEISFGARSMTDYGLIGEGTGTSGYAVKPNTIGQALFHSISKATLGEGAPSTDGITALSASYTGFKNTKLSLWNYYVHDIANNVYFDVGAKVPLSELKLDLGFQYLHQDDAGDSYAGDLDFDLFGLKAGIGNKKWSVYGVYNSSSGDNGMLNAWGGDPAYTSTIFSRNAYRKKVDAWGIGGKYVIMKGLAVLAKYVDYGQSESIGKFAGVGTGLTALDDASELDLILVWKPQQVKGLMVKTFYANRTSEYNGSNGKELKQSHWRLIASYSF